MQQTLREGQLGPRTAEDRIDRYLDRLVSLILNPTHQQPRVEMGDTNRTTRPRAVSLLRRKIINTYITPNKDKLAQGAARVEERAAR